MQKQNKIKKTPNPAWYTATLKKMQFEKCNKQKSQTKQKINLKNNPVANLIIINHVCLSVLTYFKS